MIWPLKSFDASVTDVQPLNARSKFRKGWVGGHKPRSTGFEVAKRRQRSVWVEDTPWAVVSIGTNGESRDVLHRRVWIASIDSEEILLVFLVGLDQERVWLGQYEVDFEEDFLAVVANCFADMKEREVDFPGRITRLWLYLDGLRS